MREHVATAFEQLASLSERALRFGITVNHRVIQCGRRGRQTLYVFFETDGVRLVDYWPATGTTLLGGIEGERTKVETLEEAFELARQEMRLLVEHIR